MTRHRLGYNVAMDRFIAEIRQAMTDQNVSIAELARRLGTSRSCVHRVLLGQQIPTLHWLERLASQLNLEVTIHKKSG